MAGTGAPDISEGQGGLEKLTLRHASGASVEVYLWGATLCSYKSAGSRENIFVSPGAIYDGKKAIRGGVPIVFPQFGQPDKAMAQHGFVRTSMWEVKSFAEAEEQSVATLTISDNEGTREKWPHAFSLDYVIQLTAECLTLRLVITNTDGNPFSFQALLHTYFSIPDVEKIAVSGLQGKEYVDKVDGGATKKESDEAVALPKFTDRIYIGTADLGSDVAIAEQGGVVLYEVSNAAVVTGTDDAPSTPCDIVVWNPYEEASPGDLPPPAFKGFVCVEPGLVSKFHELAPGSTAEVMQVIKPI